MVPDESPGLLGRDSPVYMIALFRQHRGPARKWWKLPLGAWILLVLLVLLGTVVYSFFFFRRTVFDYRAPHTFTVADPTFFGSAHALADPLPVEGNRIDLLNNGDEIFPAMLAAIRGARRSVNFEAFLFESGEVAAAFRDAFVERAKAGVRVRVLLDGIGSGLGLDDADVQTMKNAGCDFRWYHPIASWRVDRVNRRTHRRVMVIDGHVGFTGGVGFSDEWAGNAHTPKHRREVHARIEGPLVANLQGAFQEHWMRETGEALGGADEFPQLAPAGTLRAQVVASHAFSIAPFPLVLAAAFSAAEKRVWITNAYFTPSENQVELLVHAAKRGVDVRLIVPGKHDDQPATKAAGRTAYGKLLAGGVKLYEYEPTMIHSKTVVVDGLFSVFGSSNLDARSSAINEELDVTVYDSDFGRRMEAIFLADLQRSRAYKLEDFRERPLWERIREAAARPFRSQL